MPTRMVIDALVFLSKKKLDLQNCLLVHPPPFPSACLEKEKWEKYILHVSNVQ